MLDAFLQGFVLVFQWPTLGFLLLGVAIGIWLGAMPGLGSITGLVLLMPFTYGMEPVAALALLLGLFAVTTTSDTISSVMLGVPGTAASQAVIVDGYPMAKKGEAARAFGASFSVSAIGGVFGALVLALSLPIIKPLILSFGSPEIFMLGVLGLTLVGSLAGASLARGLAVAALGLLIGTVGYAPTVSVPRFHFDQVYLLDGLPLIPVVLGLFALPELLDLAARNTSIARVPGDQARGGGILAGMRDTMRNWFLALRCSAIGTYVGMLPGLGGSIVDWVAYAHTVQSSRDKSQFGKGDVRGVIGPDAANNASLGGSLIPALAFGIPGSLGAAILLGALVLQGVRPGPEMLAGNLHITFSMVWSIIVANVIASMVLLIWARQVAKVAFLPGHLVVPGVVLFVLMGSWLSSVSLGDWITCIAFGVLGYLMKRGGWPRPPLVLALVLGAIMERSFILSVRVHGGYGWLERPVVLIILALVLTTLVATAIGFRRVRRQPVPVMREGEGMQGDARISLAMSLALFGAFIWAAVTSLQWSAAVGNFPLGIGVVGAVFAGATVVAGTRDLIRTPRVGWRAWAEVQMLGPAAVFFGYLGALVLLALLVGQKIALPVFIALYLKRWGGYRWRVAAAGAALGWLVLVGFYDRLIRIFFMQPVLEEQIRSLLPGWVPIWLVI